MMYLEYTLQKYSDCIPVTKATNCNPLGNCVQSEYFPGALFDYLIVYDVCRQQNNLFISKFFSFSFSCFINTNYYI